MEWNGTSVHNVAAKIFFIRKIVYFILKLKADHSEFDLRVCIIVALVKIRVNATLSRVILVIERLTVACNITSNRSANCRF